MAKPKSRKNTKKTNKKRIRTQKNKMRKNKSSKNKSSKNKSSRGGGCGCSKKLNPFLPQTGGGYLNPATFNAAASSTGGNFIPMNHYNHAGSSTIDPTVGMSSRNLPNIMSGGRRRRTKKGLMKKQKGGFISTDFFLGTNNGNAVTSFANSNSVNDMKNLLTLNVQPNPLPWEQPISNFYGAHNKPLV